VLVVDDEPMIGKVVRRMLTAEHDVVTVESARDALELLEGAVPFDVILCDLMMPEQSGMDLHRTVLRTHPALAARVVFMTGGAFTPLARQYLDAVPNPRLEKPFDAKSLRALVQALVAGETV
jgi:CheY-like chemotaxis protein